MSGQNHNLSCRCRTPVLFAEVRMHLGELSSCLEAKRMSDATDDLEYTAYLCTVNRPDLESTGIQFDNLFLQVVHRVK